VALWMCLKLVLVGGLVFGGMAKGGFAFYVMKMGQVFTDGTAHGSPSMPP
jgi:hypothetical protein